MKDIIIDLLRSDGSIVVNKRLAKAIGLTEAVVYSEIVSLYKYWANRGELIEGEWFFCTDDNLSENTTIPKNTVRRKVNELVKLGLIEKELKGLPAKIHYRITDKIFEVLGLWSSKDDQNGQPDKINVSSDKNAEKPHGYQLDQNGQPRETKMGKHNNTKNNNTNKNKRERELLKGAGIEEELKEFIEVNFERFKEKGIDLHMVLNWIEANADVYTYTEFAVGLTQMLEYPEEVKNPVKFLNRTFNDIDRYVKAYFTKHKKRFNKELAEKKRKREEQLQELQESVNYIAEANDYQPKIPFYNWLKE